MPKARDDFAVLGRERVERLHDCALQRRSAIEALGRLRSREAVSELLTLLRGELWLQLAAIDALGAIGAPVAVGPLIELVPDSIMAEPAVLALQRLADPGSLGPMLARFRLVRERNLQDALLLAMYREARERHGLPT